MRERSWVSEQTAEETWSGERAELETVEET